MPIFEYRCASCGSEFDVLVLVSSPRPRCPSCRGEDLEKLMSASAVSSNHTRERTLRGAKKRAGEIRFDKEYEEHRLAHKHHHD